MSSSFVRRVDQLDAIYLDNELLGLFSSQYRKALKYLPNSFIARFGPEIEVLFKLFFKYMPLHAFNSSFGQKLFQLQYRQTSNNPGNISQKLKLLAFTSACLPWIYERVIQRSIVFASNKELGERFLEASYKAEHVFYTLYQMLTLVNFCIFLQNSMYPTVIERILCVRPLYTEKQNLRPTQNDNVDRELLWHGISEFIGFTLPLINVQKVKGFLKRNCMPWYSRNYYKKHFLQNDTCSICGEVPNFPHTINCSHVFCYYCISSILLADPSYMCLDCNIKANGIDNLKPLALNRKVS